MGITCHRGWGAKWNEVENHLRKMRTYVIRRHGKRNEKLLLRCTLLVWNKRKMNPEGCFFFFFFLVYIWEGDSSFSSECALEWRKCWMTRKIFIHSRVTTEDKFVSLWELPLSFVLFFRIIIMRVSKFSIQKTGATVRGFQLNMHRRFWNDVKKLLARTFGVQRNTSVYYSNAHFFIFCDVLNTVKKMYEYFDLININWPVNNVGGLKSRSSRDEKNFGVL